MLKHQDGLHTAVAYAVSAVTAVTCCSASHRSANTVIRHTVSNVDRVSLL